MGASAPLGSWERAITEGKSEAGVSRQPVKIQGCRYPNHCASHRPPVLLPYWLLHGMGCWTLGKPFIARNISRNCSLSAYPTLSNYAEHFTESFLMQTRGVRSIVLSLKYRLHFNCSLSFWTNQIKHPQQMLPSKNKSCKVIQWIYSPCNHWMTNVSA